MSEDAPDSAQSSSSFCLPGNRPTWYFGGHYRATESSGLGASHCPALPAPRDGSPIKELAAQLLSLGRGARGTMEGISVQQLVRTWEEGQEGSQSSGYPQAFSAE